MGVFAALVGDGGRVCGAVSAEGVGAERGVKTTD